MKQFTKLVSMCAGLVLLFGIGLFAAKDIISNDSAGQIGAQNLLTGAKAGNASKAVPAPEDDEIVIIDEDSVITEEYIPVERETIPIGPGATLTAAQEGAAAAAKILYEAGAVFLQDEENVKIARETLAALHTNTVIIGNVSKDPGSEMLSAAFFDFLGTTDDPAYSDCGITLSNAEGIVYTVSSYSRMDNVVAEHSVTMELGVDAMVTTERTAVTTRTEREDTTVSSFVITRQDADGTTTETYSATKSEPK